MKRFKSIFRVVVLAILLASFNQLSAQALSGTYSVPGDFSSLSAMATALNTNGVSGPVTINVANGTYNEYILLSNIQGTSATNTITIDGGDSSLTIVTHAGGAPNIATLTFDRVKYITVKNMSFIMTNTLAAAAAVLFYNSEYNEVTNCITKITYPTSTAANIVFSNSATAASNNGNNHNTTIQHNHIIGGGAGIRAVTNQANEAVGHKLNFNTIDSIRSQGIQLTQGDKIEIIGNVIDGYTNGTNNCYGLILTNIRQSEISRNNVRSNGMGMYLVYNTNVGQANQPLGQ